jgi:hypothetical protein
LLAFCLIWPTTLLKGMSGNSSLMVMIAVALGLRFGGPGILAILKPSLAPFALIGSKRRSWWIAGGILVLLSLPFIAETLAYPRVILDSHSPDGLLYSAWDLPLLLIPVIAWLGRTRPGPGRDAPETGAT